MVVGPKVDSLGELEAAVLDVLWTSADVMSVREVGAALKRRPTLAYTTVLTVLDRLHEKGFVAREKRGRAFAYRPRVGRAALMAERAAEALSTKGAPHTSVLLAFLDSVESRDPKVLDRLAQLIAERRATK